MKDSLAYASTLERNLQRPFQSAAGEGRLQLLLTRTHPLVEGLSGYVMEAALDPLTGASVRLCRPGAAGRSAPAQSANAPRCSCCAYVTTSSPFRTSRKDPLLAEDTLALAFAGAPQNAEWLEPAAAEQLLLAQPEANISPEQATDFVRKVEEGFDLLRPMLEQAARQRGEVLLEAHQRVSRAIKIRNVRYRVEPQLPPDILGIYVYLPHL